MGSFNVAINGDYASVADLNQFVDTFNGTSTGFATTVLGNSTTVPLVATVPVWKSGALNIFYEGYLNGDVSSRTLLGYDGSNTGWGYLQLGLGTSGSQVTLQATANGWTTTSNCTLAGSLTVNGTATTGAVTVNGNMSVSGTLNGSTALTVSQIASGGVWKTTGPSLGFTDDPSLGRFDTAPTTGDRSFGIQSQDSAGVNHNAIAVNSAGNVIIYRHLVFPVNGLSTITVFSGSGSGIFGHGAGTFPWIFPENNASAFSGVDAYSVGTTNCTINSSSNGWFAFAISTA